MARNQRRRRALCFLRRPRPAIARQPAPFLARVSSAVVHPATGGAGGRFGGILHLATLRRHHAEIAGARRVPAFLLVHGPLAFVDRRTHTSARWIGTCRPPQSRDRRRGRSDRRRTCMAPQSGADYGSARDFPFPPAASAARPGTA